MKKLIGKTLPVVAMARTLQPQPEFSLKDTSHQVGALPHSAKNSNSQAESAMQARHRKKVRYRTDVASQRHKNR